MKSKVSIFIIMCMLSTFLIGISFTTSAAVTITGTGTQEDPYLIDSQEDFVAISSPPYYGEKYYKVTDDFSITVNHATWQTDMGDSFNNPFKGYLYGEKSDGSMPTITITINATSSYAFGLFRKMQGGTIDNIKMDGTITAIGDRIAGFVGNSLGGTIKNCVNSVDVTVTSNQRAGGIVGYCEVGVTNIENCINEGEIKASGQSVGGILGDGATGTGTAIITNCINKGSISTTTNNGNGVGGIAGFTKGNITGCVNYGPVTSLGWLGGGIAGILNTGTIENCANYGSISVDYGFAGGIVGSMTGTVNKCFNMGNIIKCDSGNAGGITGGSRPINSDTADCSVTNCFNSGNLTISGYGAGIADTLGKSTVTANVTLTNNYNVGTITTNKTDYIVAICRGLDGSASKVTTASGNYCIDTIHSGAFYKNYSTSITAEQLKNLSNLTGFSNEIWAVVYSDNSNDYAYPQIIGNWIKDPVAFAEIVPIKVTVTLNKAEGLGGISSKEGLYYVKKGSTFGFTVTPEMGYKFSVTLGLAPLYTDEITETNVVTTAITEDSAITVDFELAPISSPKIDGYDKVFIMSDAIIINEGTEYEKTIPAGAKGITFGRLYIVTGYTAIEWGMAFSKTSGVLDNEANITADMRYKSSIPAAANGQLYGILFYGKGIKSNETYYTRPYAIYYDGTNYVTVYGAVTTFVPSI